MTAIVTVTCEQAVYGSFPFRDQGYDFLTATQGCRQEWLSAFGRFCRDLGQPPSENAPKIDRLLFARKIPGGPWVVALGSLQGCDDRGRPGAWAFHGLFLSGKDFRKLGLSPFWLRSQLIDTFDQSLTLAGGTIDLCLDEVKNPEFADRSMIRWVERGKRLRRVSDSDTFASSEAFWNSLPVRARRKRSMTTWAFRSDNPFHWACVSSRPPIETEDFSQTSLWHFEPGAVPIRSDTNKIKRQKALRFIAAGLVSAISLSLLTLAIVRRDSGKLRQVDFATKSLTKQEPPSFAKAHPISLSTGVHGYVGEKLADWAESLESEPLDVAAGTFAQGRRVIQAIRFVGPLLPPDFAQVSDSDLTSETVKIYVDTVEKLSRIRPWPEGEAYSQAEPDPRRVLATLAWCLRDDDLLNAAGEIENLRQAKDWFERFRRRVIPQAVPADLPATGLENRYPELVEYRLHLSRLLRMR